MKQAIHMGLTALSLVLVAATVEGRDHRATEMNSKMWSQLAKGELGRSAIEFRQGDELPVPLSAEGDFFETTSPQTTHLKVKRNFWLRFANQVPEASLNGSVYRPVPDVVSGGISAGADTHPADGIVQALKISFQAFVKDGGKK